MIWWLYRGWAWSGDLPKTFIYLNFDTMGMKMKHKKIIYFCHYVPWQGWHMKCLMLRKILLYPNKNSDLSGPVHAIPKRINACISEVPHRKFSISFQWLVYIMYEWFLQELEMACVFAIKISIYIVWEGLLSSRSLSPKFYWTCKLYN